MTNFEVFDDVIHTLSCGKKGNHVKDDVVYGQDLKMPKNVIDHNCVVIQCDRITGEVRYGLFIFFFWYKE